MITIYGIKDFDGENLGTHIDHDAALIHLRHARKYSRPGERIKIVTSQVEKLPREPIFARGDVLGYQFRMDGYGSRTFWRKIHSLRVSDLGRVVGETVIMGRDVLVEYDATAWMDSRRFDSSARWRVTQTQG